MASAGGSGRLSTARPPRAPRAMRAPELPLVLLALLLGQALRGSAAPVPGPGGPALTKMYPRGNHWAVGKCPERRLPAPGLGDPDPVSSRFWSPAWRGCAASPSSFNPRSARSSKLPSPPFRPVSPRSEGPSPVFLLLSRASAARTKEPRFLPTLPPWSPPFCSPPDGKPVWSTRHYVTRDSFGVPRFFPPR